MAMFMFPGSVYAHSSSQGKVNELRMELHGGGKKDKNHSAKKITLKKIVANMTMSNNDMIALFPDVISCMTIPSLEIKKMYDTNDIAGGESPYLSTTTANT